jgi:hypothetical protein
MCLHLRGYRILSEETMVPGTPWERHGVDCDTATHERATPMRTGWARGPECQIPGIRIGIPMPGNLVVACSTEHQRTRMLHTKGDRPARPTVSPSIALPQRDFRR